MQEPFLKSIEITLKQPVRLLTSESGISIDEEVTTLIVKPPIARHFFPRVSDISNGFSKLAFLEQNFYLERIKSNISSTEPVNAMVSELKKDIQEGFKNLEQSLTKFEPLFEQEILDQIFNGELLEAKTKQGNIVIKEEIFQSDQFPLSTYDYMALILTIKEIFFFLPYRLARGEVAKNIAKILNI